MLDHLRQKAAQNLASVHSVVLSSNGPAEIQSSRVACAAQDLTLYVYIPYHSDHLLNLEHKPEVVAVADEWDLHGTARLLAADEITAGLSFSQVDPYTQKPASLEHSAWGRVAEIRPSRLNLHSPTGQGNIETIDF